MVSENIRFSIIAVIWLFATIVFIEVLLNLVKFDNGVRSWKEILEDYKEIAIEHHRLKEKERSRKP